MIPAYYALMFSITHLIGKYGRHRRRRIADRRCKALYRLPVFLLFVLAASAAAQGPASSPNVWLTDLDGAVGPASADHIIRTLDRAAEADVALLVLRINTPGGLDNSMRDIVSAILDSPVPVATWVAPSGARAASAGTYIVAASHVAAMSATTNIGSSTPVSMGAGNTESASERKAVNDAVAYLEGLQTLRGRNIDWATQTVVDAANLTAPEALTRGIVDLLADDLEELLQAADGREVETASGIRTLALNDADITLIESDWRHDFLNVITNPNIAYILLMIGVYGLILEFYNPGLGLPGVTGIICLLVGAYALQLLPISYAGLALMAVGIGLIVLEILSPSFGVFGLGGLAAFVLGSVMLMDTDSPGWQISLPLIAAVAAATGGLIIFILGAALKARLQPVVTGNEAMLRMTAVAMENFEQTGHVHVGGETWTARARTPVRKGDRLSIDHVEGLILHVSKEKEGEA